MSFLPRGSSHGKSIVFILRRKPCFYHYPQALLQQGLHFYSTALIYHSVSPSSCSDIALSVCFGFVFFLLPFDFFIELLLYKAVFLCLAMLRLEMGQAQEPAFPGYVWFFHLQQPIAEGPTAHQQPRACVGSLGRAFAFPPYIATCFFHSPSCNASQENKHGIWSWGSALSLGAAEIF